MFELLPPQWAALAEQGFLDPAKTAVVVDLPTSNGKTPLARFRILQALNRFDADNGWVAYGAPTKVRVAQLARRIRIDFGPFELGVGRAAPETLTGTTGSGPARRIRPCRTPRKSRYGRYCRVRIPGG